jgi:hypothetical protein
VSILAAVLAERLASTPECLQAPHVNGRRSIMPQNVLISVIPAHFEEHGIRAIPLINDLFHNITMLINPEADRAFVGPPARVSLDPEPHTAPLSGLTVSDL